MKPHLESIVPSFPASVVPTVVLLERHRGRLRGPAPDLSSLEGRLELAYVHSGAGLLHGDGDPQPLRPGDLVVVPAQQAYRMEDAQGDPLGLYLLLVPRGVLARSEVGPASLPHGRVALESACATHVGRSLRRMFFEQSRPTTESRARLETITSRLLNCLPQLASGTRPQPANGQERQLPDRGLERMRAYVSGLERRFFEETTIDRAAESLSLSRRRFTQLFREVTDTTWLAYLRQLRIQHARALLTGTRRTVNSVAFECGFDDLSTFYRAFKREAGTSPNRWRQERAG